MEISIQIMLIVVLTEDVYVKLYNLACANQSTACIMVLSSVLQGLLLMFMVTVNWLCQSDLCSERALFEVSWSC